MAEETGTCAGLASELNPVCGALNALGGVDEKFWAGNTADIATMTFGSNGEISAMTMSVGTRLWPVVGKQLNHNGDFPTVDGDNIVMFKQTFNGIFYHKTSAERLATQNFALAKEVFIIANENKGNLTVWGINNQTNPAAAALSKFAFGLKGSGTGGTGVQYNDATSYTVSFSNDVPNWPVPYKPATALATNVAELVGMETEVAP